MKKIRRRKIPRRSSSVWNTPNWSVEDTLEYFERTRDPMDKAVENNDLEFVKNNLDLTDDMVLFYAIKEANTAIFEYAYPLFSKNFQQKAITTIASEGKHDYLDFALKYISIDITDSAPHEFACRGGHFDMVKRLEALGVKKSSFSFSYALQSNNLSLIQHLYAGEKINDYFRNQSHAVPLDVLLFLMSKQTLSKEVQRKILLGAAAAGYIDVIDYLLKLPNPVSSEGALFETVYYGTQLKTLKYLLIEAPIVSEVSEYDYHAFTWAYQHGYDDFTDYLINVHNVGPNSSQSVLDIMQRDNFEVYNRLLKI